MGINGARKGAKAEREINHMFTEWWGAEFKRIPGRPTGKTRRSDSVTPEDYPFSNEIKNFGSCKVFHFMRPTKDLISWWEQTKRQAEREERHPLLITKADRSWWCLLRPGAWMLFGSLPTHFMKTDINGEPLYVLPIEKFMDYKSVWKRLLQTEE